jgi:hypothetical protein
MTAQYSDIIIYNGAKHSLHTNPLEDYFNEYPDKQPKSHIRCSALWRGYVATFEVGNSELYVKDIQVMSDMNNTWRSVMHEIFPCQEIVKVDWMSGYLVLPQGEVIQYVHMGYLSTYEYYILLEIKEGDLISEKQIGHQEYQEFREQEYRVGLEKERTMSRDEHWERLIKRIRRSTYE